MARSHLSPVQIDVEVDGAELIWAKLSFADGLAYVGCAYVPPQSPEDVYKSHVNKSSKCWETGMIFSYSVI